ncbi:hypothetical protein Zm00014a_000632 [Zea mays]|uniref:Uncharacterized protein n=2 Tax=Zea mays TaxID=4577 RepID=A0A1D6ILX4_MAIZE|nr:hypothetical protein ZEAMMB73_Zm00001d022384 [Zea mays]PWZ14221.1 hypothetical protein Zm00014a_000632 [Zea mays]
MSLSPADGAAYWLRWQVLVCGALIALPTVAAAALLPRLRSSAPPLRAADLWVPCWARLHPGWLLAYRAVALAAAVALLARLVVARGITVFYFYTQWTFLLVTIYFATSAGATMLTDVTYWGLLVPFFYRDKFGLALFTDGMHSLNAVFLLIDTLLNNMPFPWYRMSFFVFWSCAYVTFQWVLHACGGVSWWPYPFLDLSSSGAPLWYLGMAIAHVPCFFLYWLIVKAKHTYFQRMFPHAYVRAT